MDKIINSAINIANISEVSKYNHFRHAAVIFSGGKIIASSSNKIDNFCHAETSAIRKLFQLKVARHQNKKL